MKPPEGSRSAPNFTLRTSVVAPAAFQRLADQQFVVPRAIEIAGVDQRRAASRAPRRSSPGSPRGRRGRKNPTCPCSRARVRRPRSRRVPVFVVASPSLLAQTGRALVISWPLLTRRHVLVISVFSLCSGDAMSLSQARKVDDTRRASVARQLGVKFGDRLAPADVRRGRGAAVQRDRPFRARATRGFRRRLGARRDARAAENRGDARATAHDHHPQRIARHFLRPVDQPLSRLRTRLRLLLRAADATPISASPPGSTSRANCS